MFERPHEPLLPRRRFVQRMVRSGIVAFAAIGVSLLVGVIGYRTFARLGWIDSILNASMILTGMGPVDRMQTASAKLFASAYAIFSGVAFLSSVGILLAPLIHRFLHRFHLEADEEVGPRRPR